MEYLVNSSEMKRCDSFTINKIGLPSMVLMERAALGALEELEKGDFDLNKLLVVCGGGNNGADGFALARLLYLKGIDVEILFLGKESKSSQQNKKQRKIVENYDIKILEKANFDEYTTIVDAIFGIGLSGPVEASYKDVIRQINKSRAEVLALDIPSGISADTGKVMGQAVRAKMTVTFAYNKVGLVLYPGADYGGKVRVKDIGITDFGFDGAYPKIYSYNKNNLKNLPPRSNYSNKGTYGKVLVIGGGINMSGAAYFAAKAAYKIGAGLVKVYTPQENRSIIQTMLPEAILNTYGINNINLESLKKAISWASVVVIGPGMGTGEASSFILKTVLNKANVPIVIDADGINILAENPEMLENHKKEIILTPHLGEMSRLVKKDIDEIKDNLIEEAENFAREKNIICVLKDTRTIVTDGSGRVYLNKSGNNGMATGGAGDVLTGVIAGLIAQKTPSLKAASLGVYVHGLSGDSAASKLGARFLLADDIVDNIGLLP